MSYLAAKTANSTEVRILATEVGVGVHKRTN